VEVVNFVLRAAGAGDSTIANDVDLDALDHEEFEQLLNQPVKQMTLSEGSKTYPLVAKSKVGRSIAIDFLWCLL
jgi:hypothetical protein